MARIDFQKIEDDIAHTLHSMFVKKLFGGEPTISPNAISYFRLDDGPRPKPEDSVEVALAELNEDNKRLLAESIISREKELLAGQGITMSEDDFSAKVAQELERIQSSQVQPVLKKQEPVYITPEVEEQMPPPKFSALFLLQKHLDWFKKKKIKDLYTLLKTTKEEIATLCSKKDFSVIELNRIEELLEAAKTQKDELIKKMGLKEDSELVEKEQKKHKSKRLGVRETWLQL